MLRHRVGYTIRMTSAQLRAFCDFHQLDPNRKAQVRAQVDSTLFLHGTNGLERQCGGHSAILVEEKENRPDDRR